MSSVKSYSIRPSSWALLRAEWMTPSHGSSIGVANAPKTVRVSVVPSSVPPPPPSSESPHATRNRIPTRTSDTRHSHDLFPRDICLSPRSRGPLRDRYLRDDLAYRPASGTALRGSEAAEARHHQAGEHEETSGHLGRPHRLVQRHDCDRPPEDRDEEPVHHGAGDAAIPDRPVPQQVG